MGVSKVEGIVPMEERIVAADTARYKFVRKDWFAYNPMRLNIGSIARWQGDNDILVSPDYVVFKCKGAGPHRLDPAYLDHFRRSDSWEEFVSEKGDGSVRVRIYYKDLAGLQLALPSFPEQQKIAECLDSADALIAAQGRKVEALKAHKKGLIQHLFPQEGETQPRLRFPEFQEAPSWVPTTIGDLGSFYYGKSAPKWSLAPDAPTPCVRYGELYSTFGPIITETYSRTNIDPATLRFSKGGEILVPRVGEKPEDFGKCCCYLPLANIAIGEMISVFETDQDSLFYTYYFRKLYRQFAKVVEGQNVKNLYYVELEPIPLFRPSIPEQKRIAGCLRSLDELIAAETQKLDSLKVHKKALIQQLFPQVGEVDE